MINVLKERKSAFVLGCVMSVLCAVYHADPAQYFPEKVIIVETVDGPERFIINRELEIQLIWLSLDWVVRILACFVCFHIALKMKVRYPWRWLIGGILMGWASLILIHIRTRKEAKAMTEEAERALVPAADGPDVLL